MTGPPKITQADWDKHKAYLHDLFITRGKTLSQVIQQAEKEQGFQPSKAQYIRQFKKWKFEKNLRGDQWKRIAKVVRSRKTYGKDSVILARNGRIPEKRLRKEISRYRPHEDGDCGGPTPEGMEAILVRTPPQGDAVHVIEYEQIPIFQFRALIAPYFERLRRRDVGPALSTPSPHTFFTGGNDILSDTPWCYNGKSRGILGSPVEVSALEWSEPSLGQSFPEFPVLEWSEPSSGQDFSWSLDPDVMSSTMLANTEPATEALRMLADCFPTSAEATGYSKTLYSHLKDITIEMRDDELANDLVQRTGPLKLEQMSLFIRYFVYLSSNNLVDNEEMDKLVEWMVESKAQWVLDPLLDLQTPTTEIFASNIFLSAARLGEFDVVRSLIARGIDIDASAGTFMPRTALEKAVLCQHPRVVELLLNEGADPKTQILSENCLLNVTLRGSHRLEILKMLLNKGTDVNAIGDEDEKGLHPQYLVLAKAVEIGDHEIIRFLLEAGADIDASEKYWGTALQFAVLCEDVQAVQILIDAGADIEATATAEDLDFDDNESYHLLRTPIQQASMAGNAEIVQILVNEGADVNAFQCEGYDTSVTWQEYRRHQWESHDTIEDTPYYEAIMMTPLQAAVLRRNPKIVQILLAAGAHVDEKRCGDTPFQMAAALDEAKLVQILRRHGADVNAPAADDGGMTALQAAARANNYELVQNLLVSGSKINAAASSSGGRTALQSAAESGNVDLAKLLIEAGADVNADASPKSGRTSLQAAVEHGHVEMVLMLLNEGADVDGSAATISGGMTALQAALWPFDKNNEKPSVRGNEPSRNTIIDALFDTGADFNAPSSPQGGMTTIVDTRLNGDPDLEPWCLPRAASSPQGGMTTIVGAMLSGRPDLVPWCLLGGADPNIPARGTTALGAAAMLGYDDLVNPLIDAGADVNAHCEMKYGAYEGILWTALHVAARTGTIEIANLLLEAGAEINMPLPSSSSQTLLHSAINGRSITMVEILLNKGADPHVTRAELPIRGRRGLQSHVDMEILNALAVAGGDFNRLVEVYHLNFNQEVVQKSLDSGALIRWPAKQKEMLDGGADFNTPARRYFGRTALQQAIVKGYTDIVTLLLSYGADVNAPAGYLGGITALQGAAMHGNLKIVLTLLQAGAEINAPPAVESGRTALQAAAEHCRLDIVSLLLQNDHDTEGVELRCERAALLAERRGHKVITRILRDHMASQSNTE